MNRTALFSLVGLAAGAAAAYYLTPRPVRQSLTSDARLALGYAADQLQGTRRPRRRKARAATKRGPARRSRRLAA